MSIKRLIEKNNGKKIKPSTDCSISIEVQAVIARNIERTEQPFVALAALYKSSMNKWNMIY